MILDSDSSTIENVLDTLPINGDFLDRLGFIGAGQPDTYSHIFIYKHRVYNCKLEVFYYHGTLTVRTRLVDPVNYEERTVHFTSQGQLENYINYLEKMHNLNLLRYEVHELLEEKIIPKLKESDEI